MKHPKNPQEVARIAATERLSGELMESSGWRALEVTASWATGPRSANLDPDAGGWRYEAIVNVDGTVDVYPIPGDPTGEAVLHDDELAGDHGRLLVVIALGEYASAEQIRLIRKAVPNPVTALKPDDLTPTQVSAAGWCTSCWRDGTYHEPVAVRPDGRRRYQDHCQWCGQFAAAHDGNPPPLQLVEARHRGERITEQKVALALAHEAEEKRKRKAERKKNKRKKAA